MIQPAAMRTTVAAGLTAALLLPAATADARRKATGGEKRALPQAFNWPPKCAKVFIATVDQRWATYRFRDLPRALRRRGLTPPA